MDNSQNTECKSCRLVKFRPLANSNDFARIIDIIETNKFWCSKFWDLNDPMEGVFTTNSCSSVDKIINAKSEYLLCSFSEKSALNDPLMWGYYANGFKGVAIEIETTKNNLKNKGEIIKV